MIDSDLNFKSFVRIKDIRLETNYFTVNGNIPVKECVACDGDPAGREILQKIARKKHKSVQTI